MRKFIFTIAFFSPVFYLLLEIQFIVMIVGRTALMVQWLIGPLREERVIVGILFILIICIHGLQPMFIRMESLLM